MFFLLYTTSKAMSTFLAKKRFVWYSVRKIGEKGLSFVGNKHLLHIGLRKMKSVLAIFVGFWIWQLIRLFVPDLEVHPIYIYIYGVLEMRETSEKTVDMGKNRLKATFTALGIGLPILLLTEFLKGFVDAQWLLVGMDLAAILLGTLVVLCVAEWVGCKALCGLAAAIFIILLVAHSDGEPITYSILRSAQTVIGIFIAWLINVKLFPYPGKKKKEL